MEMSRSRLLVFLVLLLGISSVGVVWAETGLSKADLKPQNNSGEEGTVVLSGMPGGTTKVEITLNGAAGLTQPAHIHLGNCAKLDPNPAYTLNAVVNGQSATTLSVQIGDLLGGRYAVEVHKSASDTLPVACGELTALMNSGGIRSPQGLPNTGQSDLQGWVVAALLGALVLIGLGIWQRRAMLR
jgi:LPXTG-motif cell wall-anchored protein